MQHSLVSECFALDTVFFCFFRVDVRVLKLLPGDVSAHHFLLSYQFIIACWLISSSFPADVSSHAQASNHPAPHLSKTFCFTRRPWFVKW